MSDQLIIKQRGEVLDLTLNDPDRGNLVTEEISGALADALTSVGPDVKLVRLRGAGPDFCRGRLAPRIDRATATALDFRGRTTAGPLRLYGAFRECPAPVLGVIQGQALGVGCALAGLCDLAVASEDAVFAIPEMNRNIPPALVMSALADRVPYKALVHMVLLREPVTAAAALAAGIVGQAVPAADLDRAAAAIEESVLACHAPALQAVKEYMRSAPSMAPAARASLASTLIATVDSSQTR
ncbi:MAG TPA: enoyl-CoA hydratase/isomerase family protein [Trebonia sp.]|jgi:enoyl-CoA hydratase/carnithine racemase